jgi:hypothetical protein
MSDEELKLYRVYRHYHYAEIYYVEANDEEDAIEKLDAGLIHGDFDDPDDVFTEFDFYDCHEVEQKRNKENE